MFSRAKVWKLRFELLPGHTCTILDFDLLILGVSFKVRFLIYFCSKFWFCFEVSFCLWHTNIYVSDIFELSLLRFHTPRSKFSRRKLYLMNKVRLIAVLLISISRFSKTLPPFSTSLSVWNYIHLIAQKVTKNKFPFHSLSLNFFFIKI